MILSSHFYSIERNAKIDNENAIKYNWKGFFPLKPYIGDIFKDLIKIHSIAYN